ncbi:mRNA splicing factor (ISS) [Galdieria sulphuraria]|uniref:mRNA splicing factor (ISS) n=1 Tax=Galdieria sulphuraria TaxID=130081 RepID=M2Y7L7_GALSU|nr:mRNA splicing factor (ISS) [Galdieria sulphuraria]EME31819.1 mRNA splicing factor (ISS) [Galdieria sulphuraria]|eukprot:XP_005708339.1 mRNA splicing factor (ISS) [Galdieria sulphuraria]
MRSGIFFEAFSRQLIIFGWDSDEECFRLVEIVDNTELWRQSQFNVHLALVPPEADREWKRQSSYLTKELLHKLNLKVFSQVQPGQVDELYGSLANDSNSVAGYTSNTVRTPIFTPTPSERRASNHSTPEEITKFNMDATQRLDTLLEHYRNLANDCEEHDYADKYLWREEYLLLGEQQVSFILFMLLFSLPGLEQWKKLTDLLCSCDDMLFSRAHLFSIFTRNLRFQLEAAPCDLFTDELSVDNFLRGSLEKLFDVADETSSLDASLKKHIEKLKDMVIANFGWCFREGKTFFSMDDNLEDEPTYVPYEKCATYLSNDSEVQPDGKSSTESLSKTMSRTFNEIRSVESSDFQSRKQNLQKALDSVNPHILP